MARSVVSRYGADTAFMTFVALLMAFLYVPIWVLIAFSFSSSRSLTWPIPGFTLDWYRKLFANEDLLTALGNSFYVAILSTVLSLVVGVAAAMALHRFHFPGKTLFRRLILLPITLPGIVTGISMLNMFSLFGMPLSLETVIFGHATALLGVVVTQIYARLQRIPRSLEEASGDLGATPLRTFLSSSRCRT
jgi:spermidine/putrescine transport system permease protein